MGLGAGSYPCGVCTIRTRRFGSILRGRKKKEEGRSKGGRELRFTAVGKDKVGRVEKTQHGPIMNRGKKGGYLMDTKKDRPRGKNEESGKAEK